MAASLYQKRVDAVIIILPEPIRTKKDGMIFCVYLPALPDLE